MKLQDIETAPKDGTNIIAYGEHMNDCDDRAIGFCQVYWISDLNRWCNITGYPSIPVSWMPLPDTNA